MRRTPQLVWWDAVLSIVVLLLVGLTWFAGIGTNAVTIFLTLSISFSLVARIRAYLARTLETGFVRRPFAPEHRWYLVQALVRGGFVVVWALVMHASIARVQLGDQLASMWSFLGVVLVAVGLFPLLPLRRILGARLVLVGILGIFFGAQLVMALLPTSGADVVTLDPPMRQELVVFQGGPSPIINHHWLLRAQRNALDLVVARNGRLVDGDANQLASYGCFGEPVLAPQAGTVVKAVTDLADLRPGRADLGHFIGNHVVLAIAPERFVLLAHLQKGSVVVHEGEQVTAGQPLGACGNTGNTSFPHLHIQVQDRVDPFAPDGRTYPIAFRGTSVPLVRNARIAPL